MNEPQSRVRRNFGAFAIILLTLGMFGCDHATKSVAENALSHRSSMTLVHGVLDLRYAENRDTAFSLLHGVNFPHRASVLVALSLVAIFAVSIAWWKRRTRARFVEHAAFALIFAGAVGNIADRARRGFVVDFIHVEHWPVFNVADASVVVGVVLLAIIALIERGKRDGALPSSARDTHH